MGREVIVDIVDDGVHVVGAGHRARIVEQADDGGVFLEGADEGSDDDIEDLGRHQRNGHAPERLGLAGAVDLGGVVVLGIDALETGEEDEDLERDRRPDDVDAKRNHGRPSLRAGDPHDIAVEEIVDDAVGIEHDGEDHADGDGVCDIGEEEDGLEELLEPLQRIEADGDEKGDEGRKRDGDQDDDEGVGDGVTGEVEFRSASGSLPASNCT